MTPRNPRNSRILRKLTAAHLTPVTRNTPIVPVVGTIAGTVQGQRVEDRLDDRVTMGAHAEKPKRRGRPPVDPDDRSVCVSVTLPRRAFDQYSRRPRAGGECARRLSGVDCVGRGRRPVGAAALTARTIADAAAAISARFSRPRNSARPSTVCSAGFPPSARSIRAHTAVRYFTAFGAAPKDTKRMRRKPTKPCCHKLACTELAVAGESGASFIWSEAYRNRRPRARHLLQHSLSIRACWDVTRSGFFRQRS